MIEVEYANIGMRIRTTRKSLGLTLNQMAEKLEMSKTQLCRIENGSRRLQLNDLIHFCKELHVSSDYLLGLEEEKDNFEGIAKSD